MGWVDGWLLAEARKRALSRRFVCYVMGGLFIDGNGWTRGREREREEWVDGWTSGMGGFLFINHDSIYG
jgi:hypothetical protein